MLNKWDYRYPHFGLQKLHMGYGYGYPIYPQVSKHKDFMSLVNSLENRMTNIEDNVSNISQDVVDELHALLEQFNEIDTIISVDDVQTIVESAIDNIEYPEYITIENVRGEITQAINQIDIGLSALEVQTMISDSIDELDVGLSESQVTMLIHESLAMIDTGLNYTQVQDLINLTLANLDVGMTEDDVVDLIQFHVQAIPIDSIQSELASLRTTIETLDVPDVDLSDIYSRLLTIESQLDGVGSYDDEWIHTEIQSLNNLIQGIETGDVDLSEVNSRLEVLESKVDNDTIYDDTELRNLVVQLREDLDSLDVGDVDLSEVNSRLEVLESKVDNDTIYDDEWIHTEIQSLNDLIQGIETGDVDLSEYVKHDYISKEVLTALQFTPNQSPQTYQVELSESTVDVYINLDTIHKEIIILSIVYSHLTDDEQTELEELFNSVKFDFYDISLVLDVPAPVYRDVNDVSGHFNDGVYKIQLEGVNHLLRNIPSPLPLSGDSIDVMFSFRMRHRNFDIGVVGDTQTININHDMNIIWRQTGFTPTNVLDDIISSSFAIGNINRQFNEINNDTELLKNQIGYIYPTLNDLSKTVRDNHSQIGGTINDVNVRINNIMNLDLEQRILTLESRLDNLNDLGIPEPQRKEVEIVRDLEGDGNYPMRPDVELAIYFGSFEPDPGGIYWGDLWIKSNSGEYSVYTSEGWKQSLYGQVK